MRRDTHRPAEKVTLKSNRAQVGQIFWSATDIKIVFWSSCCCFVSFSADMLNQKCIVNVNLLNVKACNAFYLNYAAKT